MTQRYKSRFSAIAALIAFTLVAMALPGCSDSTVAPPNSTAGAKTGHSGAFDMRVGRSNWKDVKLAVTWAPAPYQAKNWLDSRATVGEYTGGKIIMAYHSKAGRLVKKMARVSVHNRTRAMMNADGQSVTTLGELFQAVDGDVADTADTLIEVCVYFERYVGFQADPVYSLREVATFLNFAAIEPAALDSVKPPSKCYVTDKGNKVPYSEDPYPDEPDVPHDTACQILRDLGLKDSVEEKSGPTDTTNCHGWTFTCGKDWINDPSQIIEDNGYREVPADSVQAGDIIVYKDSTGNITHTGIVRIKDGKVVIDSKWGRLGRYCHSPENSPYGNNFCYMRTDRPAPPGSTDPDKDKHTITTK